VIHVASFGICCKTAANEVATKAATASVNFIVAKFGGKDRQIEGVSGREETKT
jgi:hypothetical protein